MNTKTSRYLLLGLFAFLFLLAIDPVLASGTGLQMNELFNAPNSTNGTGLQNGLADMTKWVFWVFYLLGAIFMGVGAFKLKQGDIGGFGKNMAGGATLFFVPAAIRVLQGMGQTATNG